MPKRILRVLVPIDFSAPSLRAFDHALDWDRQARCELHLVHVVEPDGNHTPDVAGELAHDFAELERMAEVELHRLAPRVSDERIGAIQRHVRSGRPATSILELAERLKADLIIMGTHGRTGLRSLLMGSVAEMVVRRAPCSVVCVKPDAPAGATRWRRIVCAVDFSECSRRAMLGAVDLARDLSVELLLLHVHKSGNATSVSDAERALDEWKKQAEARADVKVVSMVVVGAPAPKIVDFARKDVCDLLVVGTHGHTALLSLLMGSVAEQVVRAAPCPVLTVRPAR